MKTKILLIGIGLCLLSSFCRAGIIGVALEADGDGALVCNTFSYDSGGDTTVKEVSAPMVGDQSGEVAHINGTITTSSALDPTLAIGNSIDNDTDFDWTAYNVNVYMSSYFDILNEYVSTPTDWTVSVIQPTLVGSDYMGQIQYSGGTPVAVGGTFAVVGFLNLSGRFCHGGYLRLKGCAKCKPSILSCLGMSVKTVAG